eukprot:8446160-Alexandrium_andersonii.AAC.1
MAKLNLQNAQRIRELEGAVFMVALGPKDSPLLVAANEAGRAYHEAAEKSKEHGLGAPHVHKFIASLQVMLEHPGMKDNGDLK